MAVPTSEQTDEPRVAVAEALTEEEEIPEDFAALMATRIVLLNEKEFDPMVSSANVAEYVYENTNDPKKIGYFFDVLELLINNEQTKKYGALSFAALSIHSEVKKEYEGYIEEFATHLIENHYDMTKPEISLEKKKYSAYSTLIGLIFIKMVEINRSLYDSIHDFYSQIIREEMELEAEREKQKEEEKKVVAFKKTIKKAKVTKKLYDDTIDFVSAKGDFKSTSLNQENPNEHIAILADSLRGTRRYVIQDIMNKRALEKKKRLEKELSERLASAEEIIMSTEPFQQALSLFWKEKQYTYKFLSVEKIRVALRIIGIILGAVYWLLGYIGMWGVHWFEGIFVFIGMYTFVKFAGSRKNFKSFYPYDVSKELESNANSFIHVFRHMSKEQMYQFTLQQVKMKQNEKILQIVPEFIKYLYTIMSDRKNLIMSVEELSEIIESLEVDIAKQLRRVEDL